MTTEYPEALRLADVLEDGLVDYDWNSIPRICQDAADEAAAELRRLYAENAELLEALQLYLAHAPEPECAIWRHVQARARAAIAKATGETK